MNFRSGYYPRHPAADYFNSMDRKADVNEGYHSNNSHVGHTHSHEGHDHSSGNSNSPGAAAKAYLPDLGISDIGMSVPMGISAGNVAGIYSKIRMGAGNIEIQFPGHGSGNRNAQTPEMLGEDQRQAIRELAMANDVRFTTHASFQLMGLMGRDERGNFSITGATRDLWELKRAIDFQADLGGGSVVIHSGEFERPMTDMYLDDESGRINLARDRSGRLMFKQAHTQEHDAKFELLDDRTSARIESVQKDKMVANPVWNRAKENKNGIDQDGNEAYIKRGDYVDYDGRLIKDPYDPLRGRVPEFDSDKKLFKVELKSFEEFRKEAEEYNKWFERTRGRKPDYYEKMYAEEAYVKATLDSQESVARGWSLQFSARAQSTIKALKVLEEKKRFYEDLERNTPEHEQWKLLRQDDELYRLTQGFAAPELRKPSELIEKALFDTKRTLEYDRSTAAGQEQQAKETRETKDHIITPIKRLEKQGIRMYAEAAIHAIQKTKDPSNPVVLAVEHIFPERFGGHPEELKWIISKTRERVVDYLTNPYILDGSSLSPTEITEGASKGLKQPNPFYMGISHEEAAKIAEKHVKATIDTGHINLWRKYWQDDPRISKEQNDRNFNKWAVDTIESLAREKMVGNVHLADNYGYHDDHLAPGQGNSPIRDIVSSIRKYGYDKAFTVEPGADASTDLSDFHGLMKTWKFFGSPVYGMGFRGSSAPQAWGDIQYSFAGQNKPPYYIFGGYAPSNDWTLWTQVPLE